MSVPNDEFPIENEGTRIVWIWEEIGVDEASERSTIHGESVFLAASLREKYERERYALHFEEFTRTPLVVDWLNQSNWEVTEPGGAAADFLEQVPAVQEALHDEQIPREAHIEAAFSTIFRSALDEGRVGRVISTVIPHATSLNAPRRQFEREEEQTRDRESDLSTSPADPEYSGPLYLYNRVQDTKANILELKAPINIAWHAFLGSTGVQIPTRMETNGWRGYYNHSRATRNALVSGTGSTIRLRSHGAEAAKRNSRLPAKQWHVRMVEIPDAMDLKHDIAGNAHHDPHDHGQLLKQYRNPNWKFKQSRQETTSDWYDWGYEFSTQDAGNGIHFDSSDGELDVIQPL